jgi:hypothetical protein
MQKISQIWIVLLLCCIGVACEKSDPELLSGDISGIVEVYDENQYLLEDMSGVQLSLADGTFSAQTSSDPSGKFLFEDIDYGNYQADLALEGYIKTYGDKPVHHLGGYSPTMVEYKLYEVPKFETRIDSFKFNGTYERSYVYVNLQELSGIPKIAYIFWCFFSDSPDVSEENFVGKNSGWMWSPELDGLLTEISVEIWDYGFDQLDSDTIYLRVYPQAWGQGYYDYYPESLGKASNVISFRAE